MSNIKKISFNTLAMYSRSILAAFMAIFSSRWVLQALGVTDFGLFTLIGSIIVFIVFLNNIMSSSASRYFSYEIGRGSSHNINKWFNTALSVHMIIPIILILIGYPTGVYLIKNIFDIPIDRIFDSIIILRISMITAFLSMISVPFIAMYIAKQKFVELAFIGLIQSLSTFIAAFLLLKIPGNKLIIHTILIALIQVSIYAIQISRAMLKFEECRIQYKYWFNKSRFMSLITFAFWNLFGNLGHLMRTQGLAFLTNIYFGTKGNAAYGISNQLSTHTSNLTNALSTSVNPEIIRCIGGNNIDKAIKLSIQATKMGVVLILLLTIPIITEIDYILNIWLVTVPPSAKELSVLMMIVFMIEKATLNHETLLQAINKISRVQIFQGIIFTSSVLVAYILIKTGYGIQSIGWSIIITMLLSRFNLAFWVSKYLGVSIMMWVKKIIIPYILISIISFLIANNLKFILDDGIMRVIVNVIISFMVIISTSWFFLLNIEERYILKRKIKNKITQ